MTGRSRSSLGYDQSPARGCWAHSAKVHLVARLPGQNCRVVSVPDARKVINTRDELVDDEFERFDHLMVGPPID